MAESLKEEALPIQRDETADRCEEMRKDLRSYFLILAIHVSGVCIIVLMSGARHWQKFREVYFCPLGGCIEKSNPRLYATMVAVMAGLCMCSLAAMIWRIREYRRLDANKSALYRQGSGPFTGDRRCDAVHCDVVPRGLYRAGRPSLGVGFPGMILPVPSAKKGKGFSNPAGDLFKG